MKKTLFFATGLLVAALSTASSPVNPARAVEIPRSQLAQESLNSAYLIRYCGSDAAFHYFHVERPLGKDSSYKILRQMDDFACARPFSPDEDDWADGRDFYMP